jgi:hypothetical protein
MLGEFKTEIIGISTEVAIADEFGVTINDDYRCRANEQIITMTRGVVKTVFAEYDIPTPILHIAEGQNPVDFMLANGKTLSVKSNKKSLGKVAPQNVGQPTAATYWKYFADFADVAIPADYKGKTEMFKRVSLDCIDEVMNRYWKNIFDCDYLIHFYDFCQKSEMLNSVPKYVAFAKRKTPAWERKWFSFTQTVDSWNESNTVKYCGESIGEFQVHNNRDCFKFRFNMKGIANLMEKGII